jgi:hypothetical protein
MSVKYPVKVTYNAYRVYQVEASSMETAHKKAYNLFMDGNLEEILCNSHIDLLEYGVETSILQENGSDMLHF